MQLKSLKSFYPHCTGTNIFHLFVLQNNSGNVQSGCWLEMFLPLQVSLLF